MTEEGLDRRMAERRATERRIGGTGYQGVERRVSERRSGLDRRAELTPR